MPQLIIPYLLRIDILAKITGVGGPLVGTGLSVGLIKAGLSAGTRTTRAEVLAVEPSNVEMPGYAAITPTVWGGQYRDGSDNVFQDAGEMEWILTADAPAPLNIVGAYWASATRVVIELFDSPVQVKLAGDIVRYVPQMGYGQ